MANILLNNVFRIAVSTLNFVSPSIVGDILLHPFDFATVLLQIGFYPEGNKYETATLVSVILQYAIFTCYIPCLLTSIQGLQFMGMPHPSIFYYVNYIYKKDGFTGCYRGLIPKICERLTMITVNERIRRRINKDLAFGASSHETVNEWNEDSFLQNLIKAVCSQFFAVLASHPFHVIMVSSFAEFTYNKKSSIFELSCSIYNGDGCFGFFTGLTARLLGELLSLIFSVAYTTIINKQMKPWQAIAISRTAPSPPKTANHLVNYVTDISRFTGFKQKSVENEISEDSIMEEDSNPIPWRRRQFGPQRQFSQCRSIVLNVLGSFTQNRCPVKSQLTGIQDRRRSVSFLAYIPLTSRLFYYIILRDFLSKKISNPFFLVCHCAIVLDTGWDKFPLLSYLVDFTLIHLNIIRKKVFKKTMLNYYFQRVL